MILELREHWRWERARQAPTLSYLTFSLTETLEQVRSELFRDLRHRVDICFVGQGALGCICQTTHDTATIYIHAILNHPDTPRDVISLICKHELLHLEIPPRPVNGVRRQHPPEFCEREREIAPELDDVWEWIWSTRWPWLKPRPRLERIDVSRKWKEVWNREVDSSNATVVHENRSLRVRSVQFV